MRSSRRCGTVGLRADAGHAALGSRTPPTGSSEPGGGGSTGGACRGIAVSVSTRGVRLLSGVPGAGVSASGVSGVRLYAGLGGAGAWEFCGGNAAECAVRGGRVAGGGLVGIVGVCTGGTQRPVSLATTPAACDGCGSCGDSDVYGATESVAPHAEFDLQVVEAIGSQD